MIFCNATDSTFHGKTLTSFSMFRGLGLGKPIMTLKNSSVSGLALETVSGLKPSKFRRMRFFSSTVKRAATIPSRSEMVSTLVTYASFFSAHQMQLTDREWFFQSSCETTLKVVKMSLPFWSRSNTTIFRRASNCSSLQSLATSSRLPSKCKRALLSGEYNEYGLNCVTIAICCGSRGECCGIVDVRTSLGLDAAEADRGPGVAGARGLCSVLAVVNDGLTVGV